MMLRVVDKIEEFAAIQADWHRLAARERKYFPLFSDIFDYALAEGKRFQLVVSEDDRGIQAIACFLTSKASRGFWLGPRKLLDIPVQETVLQGAAILGSPEPVLAGAMLDRILADPEVTFVNLGNVDTASGLYAAAQTRRWNWLKHESDWRATRRIIVLPPTMADYLASLRSSTRKAVLRDQRIFQKLRPEFRVMTRADEMRGFLVDAAKVGDKTYQTGFAFGIDASEWRIRMLEQRAGAGRLFAFAAYLDGIPCAFCWGEVSYDVFYFSYTGFDPAYRKHCAGTAILLYAIEHLIDRTPCTRFDFGIRDMDYKARFATTPIACADVILGRGTRPAAALAVLLVRLNDALKVNLLRLAQGKAKLQTTAKAMLS